MTNIIKTTDNYADANGIAKEITGYGIFDGYQGEDREIAIHREFGVSKYYVTDAGDILYIVEYQGQRVLNKLTLSDTLSAGKLGVGVIEDDKMRMLTDMVVDKGDSKERLRCAKYLNKVYPNSWFFYNGEFSHMLTMEAA